MSLWRRGWFRMGLGTIAVLVIGIIAYIALDRQSAHGELQKVVEGLDTSEPGWRLDQIEGRRPALAKADNGAEVVRAAYALLPGGWISKTVDEYRDTPPQVQVRPEDLEKIRDELKGVQPALLVSRKLVHYPAGRFPITYAPDFYSTRLIDQQNSRTITLLLVLDAAVAIEDKNPRRALASVQAILHIARYFDEEPLLISQLIRIAKEMEAVRTLERTLAHGPVEDKDLAILQHLLEEEAAAPLFVAGMRGERAGVHECFNDLVRSDESVTARLEMLSGGASVGKARVIDQVIDFPARTFVIRSNTAILKFETKVIEAASTPGYKGYTDLRAIDVDKELPRHYSNMIARMLVPAVVRVSDVERRGDTILHCTIAAVAAERFRMTNGRWPKTLEELVDAELLKSVPEDLYTGDPVRLRVSPDGIVVYSVGKTGTYTGDALDRPAIIRSTDERTEFRLWDVENRRQPPLPPKKDVDIEP